VIPLPRRPFLDESIVEEAPVLVKASLLTRNAQKFSRVPAMKDFLRQVQTTLTSSARSRRRRPYGSAGFLDSDYVMKRILHLIPREDRGRRLVEVEGIPQELIDGLGAETTLDEAAAASLEVFARRTGLTLSESAQARFLLFGIDPPQRSMLTLLRSDP